MAVASPRTHRSCSSRPRRRSSRRPPAPPFLYELTPDEARKVLDDVQAAPIDKLPVDEHWITVPAEVGDVRVRIVRPPGADGHAAGDPLHARRRLGARQRRHPRPARPRARRRRRRRASSFVEYDRSPEARYPVAIEQGYADRPVDRPRGRRRRARPGPHGRRRRLGRRQHDRRAGAHGQASAATCASCTSRCTTRSPTPRMDTDSLRAVRRRLLPHREGDGVVLGRLPARPSSGAREPFASPLRASRRAARRAPAGAS